MQCFGWNWRIILKIESVNLGKNLMMNEVFGSLVFYSDTWGRFCFSNLPVVSAYWTLLVSISSFINFFFIIWHIAKTITDSSPSIKTWSLYLQPLNLDRPCDLLWTVDCGRRWKRFSTILHTFLEPLNYHGNKLSLACCRWETIWKGETGIPSILDNTTTKQPDPTNS